MTLFSTPSPNTQGKTVPVISVFKEFGAFILLFQELSLEFCPKNTIFFLLWFFLHLRQIMWFVIRKIYLWHFLVEWPFQFLHSWLYSWGLRDVIVILEKGSWRKEFGVSTSELRSLVWPLFVPIKALINVYYLLSALYVHVSVLFTELGKMM